MGFKHRLGEINILKSSGEARILLEDFYSWGILSCNELILSRIIRKEKFCDYFGNNEDLKL